MGIRGELFSTKVALQNRTYFFNVKENRLGDLYLNIVESKNRDAGGFDRQSVILFADDLTEFLQGFEESLRVLEKATKEKRRTSPRKVETPYREDREDSAESKGRGFREDREYSSPVYSEKPPAGHGAKHFSEHPAQSSGGSPERRPRAPARPGFSRAGSDRPAYGHREDSRSSRSDDGRSDDGSWGKKRYSGKQGIGGKSASVRSGGGKPGVGRPGSSVSARPGSGGRVTDRKPAGTLAVYSGRRMVVKKRDRDD